MKTLMPLTEDEINKVLGAVTKKLPGNVPKEVRKDVLQTYEAHDRDLEATKKAWAEYRNEVQSYEKNWSLFRMFSSNPDSDGTKERILFKQES